MAIDFTELAKQIDAAQVPGGVVLDSTIPRTDTLAETGLYARINGLCVPVSNSINAPDSQEPSDCPDNHNEINTMSARGKFSPEPKSFKTMTHCELRGKLGEMSGDVRKHQKSFNYYRRAIGQGFDEMRTRIAEAGGRLVIQEGEPAVNWEEFCTSIGENRRSASKWADNARTIRDAASNLHDAAQQADIDLFQPRTAKILRAINEELAGKVPSGSEIPALLDRLDPPNEPKIAMTRSAKRKSGNRRRKPKLALTAPQPIKAQTANELRENCSQFVHTHPEVKKGEPFLVAFIESNPLAQADEVFRPLIRNFLLTCPVEKRRAIAEIISNVAAALGDSEFSDVPEDLNPPSASMPSPLPTADGLSPLPETTAKRPPTPEWTPYLLEEINPELRGTFIKFGPPQPVKFADISESAEDTFAGERKPVASEATPHKASESDSEPSSAPMADVVSPSSEQTPDLDTHGDWLTIEFDSEFPCVDLNDLLPLASPERKPPARETLDEAFVTTLAERL